MRWLAAAGVVAVLACSDGAPTTVDGPEAVARVVVSPAADTVEIGETLQVSASALDDGNSVLSDRAVTWSSNVTSVAVVSSEGLVTALGPGRVRITASSEGRSATARITVRPATATRSVTDRPDDVTGPQIHVMYVRPRDAEDRELDTNGTLALSVASFAAWFTQHSNGLAFRFDRIHGDVDITYHEMSRTDAEMAAFGAFVVTEIERELGMAGRLREDKLYLVYYDGTSTHACGGAAWPPQVPGRMAAMYLRGAPNGGNCGLHQFVSSSAQFPGYWEFSMLHDLMHLFGIVAVAAPNHTPASPAHVPEPRDLMYGGSFAHRDHTTMIDVGGDDYFGETLSPGVGRLEPGPFITAGPMPLLRLMPLDARAALRTDEALRLLPPHPPFPLHSGPPR